jgi:hypothetical protein
MKHIKSRINFYRLFDLSSLALIDCYTNYNKVVRIISYSKKHQYADFQLIQQDAANYLINDKSKSNFIELQLVNINYTFEKAFDDNKFDIVGSEFQYNENNVKITNSNFLLFNYKGNSKVDIADVVEKYTPNIELIVEQDWNFKDKFNLPKQIFLEDGVIFRKKLKKILKKLTLF